METERKKTPELSLEEQARLAAPANEACGCGEPMDVGESENFGVCSQCYGASLLGAAFSAAGVDDGN